VAVGVVVVGVVLQHGIGDRVGRRHAGGHRRTAGALPWIVELDKACKRYR
jgi:hypothetical protein